MSENSNIDQWKKVKFIGNVPKDWKVTALGEISDIEYGIQASVAQNLDPSIGVPILTNINISNDGKVDLSLLRYYDLEKKDFERYLLKKGDILFNWRSGSKNHIGKTALWESNKKFTHSSFILRIRSKNQEVLTSKFIFYFLTFLKMGINFFKKNLNFMINATFNATSTKKIKIFFPPLDEQQKITTVLSNLDCVINKTEIIIYKLHILKKGLMQRLFTEGIGHTEFKETKLGKIPKEWKIIQFQELILKIKRGESKKTNFEGKGVLYLTSDYIQDNKIVWENKKYLETEKDIGPYLLEEDDIIINCVNSFARVGKVALFRSYYEPVVIGFNNFAVKVNLDLLDPNYLVYYFNSEKGYKEIIRTTKPAINQVSFSAKDVNIFKIILPSLNEQKKMSSKFLTIDNKIENEIFYRDKLKEIKKGLMQDLLTGKKRVKIN